MKKPYLLAFTLLFSSVSLWGQVTIDVDAADKGVKISPNLYGIFFEDINHAADGGLYAELISNRSFEDSRENIPTWSTYASTGSTITATLTDKNLLNAAQGQALEVAVDATPAAPVCLVNEGFWGINAVQGRTYKLSFWAKGSYKGTLKACLSDKEGKQIYAETNVDAQLSAKNWKKYTATMTATGNDPKAQFSFVADGKGTITFDVVSLFPPTYKNRENGCRPELAQLLAQLQPKFMRFPGGCFVEGQESPDNAFRWERTIGPIEERPGHLNLNWRYRTSDGLGFHEYLQLSEDLGAKPLYVVNVGLWHGGMTPVEELQPWIDECMNALEYANGDVTTKYGALRAKNGHPAPFNIEYLEIGNENNQYNPREQSDRYYERYKKFKDAVLAKYPNMHLIGNVVAWGDDNPQWRSTEQVELLDEHYYRSPVWFSDNFHKYDTYARGGAKIYCGEYAVTQGFGKIGNLNAALGEAVFMMGMENNADVVEMASYAPIFVNENNVAWQPDMIRFNSSKVMCTPSYYVQQLMAKNVGTRVLPVKQENPYEATIRQKTVRPAVSHYGLATWRTAASFQFTGTAKPIKGKWGITENVVTQTSMEEACISMLEETVGSGDSKFQARARKDSGDEGFIIVFNYVDENNYCWVNFGGWGNTQHAIEQVVNGSKMQTATTRGSVEQGKWYNIEVEQKGDNVKVWLDGQVVFDVKLKPYTAMGVFSSASIDETTGDVIVKVVNTMPENTTARINLRNHGTANACVTRLASAQGTDENTIDNPTRIYPVQEIVTTDAAGLLLDVPANSLNIVRVK